AERSPTRVRDLLDAYFTAFFNAWIDNQGLRTAHKHWISAMSPGALRDDGCASFFADYPDGRVIVPIRDPRAWYASASLHRRGLEPVEPATRFWSETTAAALAAKQRCGDRIFLARYEAVIEDTEGATRKIAAWLGIEWDPLLLMPTFNRLPTWPNSS